VFRRPLQWTAYPLEPSARYVVRSLAHETNVLDVSAQITAAAHDLTVFIRHCT
jgi:hypothetical protein